MPKIYLGSLPEPINCKSFTLTLSLNTDMNAEQLARDIKSLDQAHRAADEALKPYPGLSIGAKVESLAASYEALKAQQPVDDFSSKVRSEIRSEISSSLGKSCLEVRSLTTQNLVHMLIDRLRALKAEQGNTISSECSQATHNQLNRVLPRSLNRLDVRVKELVDELLKLRQQGETNNSRLEEEDRLEIRAKLIEAIGGPANSAWSTCSLVNQIVGSLASSRSEVAELARKNSELHARLGAKGAELAELQQKHQQLHDNFKLLQHFSSGQPKGLAPEKEKWRVSPSQCLGRLSGLFRVMRGNVDATPHPVSEAVAKALCEDLNSRGV